MIINRIYGHQNLLSLQLVSFLVGLRTYQHPCISSANSLYTRLIILVFLIKVMKSCLPFKCSLRLIQVKEINSAGNVHFNPSFIPNKYLQNVFSIFTN